MIAWLSGDGNSNDIFGANGTRLSGADFAPGEVAQAFTFPGGSSAVQLPSTSLHQAFTTLSVEAWVFPTANGHDSSSGYGLTILSNTDSDGFALRVKDGLLQADVRTTGLGVFQVFTSQSVALNQWSHVAMTYDGSAVKMYLNGQLLGSASASGAIANSNNATTCPMIGNEPTGCSVDTSGFSWQGKIDEVQIFNRALSLVEIQTSYNAGAAGNCKPNP